MGILSFIAEQNALNQQKQQAEQERQFRLQEIAARGESQKDVLRTADQLELERQKAIKNMEMQAARQTSAMDQSSFLEKRLQNLMAEGKTPMEAGAQANAEWNNMQTLPGLVPQSAANYKLSFNAGMQPYAKGIGDITGQAGLEEATATRNDAYNRAKTAKARVDTMPQVASAEDQAAIANAQKQQLMSTSAMPGIPGVTSSEQAAAQAENELRKTQAGFNTKVTGMLNPQTAATAQNVGNEANIAGSALEANSGGAFTKGVGNATIGNYMVDPKVLALMQQLLTSSMTNRNVAPTANPSPTTPSQLTPRKPQYLPQGITLPME